MVLGLSGKILVLVIIIVFLSSFVAIVSLVVKIDSNPPTIAIKTPTKEAEYVTNTGFITISGSAYDDIGLGGIGWTNKATDENGNCSGSSDLSSWASTSIVLIEGKNLIDLKAWDRSGNIKHANITIYLDTVAPNCTIKMPTRSSTYSTHADNISLVGGASDNRGIESVEWINSANSASGTALLGLTKLTWSAQAIDLRIGENVITVTVKDAAGNYGEDHITVTRLA